MVSRPDPGCMREHPMIWWIKARRWRILLIAFGVYFALLVSVRDRQMVLPNLHLGTISVVLAMWFPVLPTVCLVACLESKVPAAEIAGTRRVGMYDVVASISTVLVASLLGATAMWLTSDTSALSTGRNTAFLVGLTLAARSIVGPRAVIFTVLWPITVSLIGFHGSAQPYHWTILPERPTAWYAAVGAGLALVVGLVAQHITARKRI